MEAELRKELEAGITVLVDSDLANGGGKVEVVRQTPKKLFTTVKDVESGNEWDIMTYRLTKLKQ